MSGRHPMIPRYELVARDLKLAAAPECPVSNMVVGLGSVAAILAPELVVSGTAVQCLIRSPSKD